MVEKTAQRAEPLGKWLKAQKISEEEAKEMLTAIQRDGNIIHDVVSMPFEGKSIKIGVISDTHFGNKWTDKRFLEEVYKKFKREGVELVYHTGDITDGPWQRHNNILEQYKHGIEEQVQDVVNDLPSIEGVKTYVILGDHDKWYQQMGAGTVGELVAEKRPDVVYLGSQEAMIKLGKLYIMLSHPNDGTAYAYSYKPQKFLESMFKMGEHMPDVILQGHYHKLFQMQFGGVAFFSTGTTEHQTPWMRGKKISADVGAWILDIRRADTGRIAEIKSELLPYYGNKHMQMVK